MQYGGTDPTPPMPMSILLRTALKDKGSHNIEFVQHRIDDLVSIPELQYFETLDKLHTLEQKIGKEVRWATLVSPKRR